MVSKVKWTSFFFNGRPPPLENNVACLEILSYVKWSLILQPSLPYKTIREMVSYVELSSFFTASPSLQNDMLILSRELVGMVSYVKWQLNFYDHPSPTKHLFDSAKKVDMVSYVKWSWLNFPPSPRIQNNTLIVSRRMTWSVESSENDFCTAAKVPYKTIR